jgi:hypothetical protein
MSDASDGFRPDPSGTEPGYGGYISYGDIAKSALFFLIGFFIGRLI